MVTRPPEVTSVSRIRWDDGFSAALMLLVFVLCPPLGLLYLFRPGGTDHKPSRY